MNTENESPSKRELEKKILEQKLKELENKNAILESQLEAMVKPTEPKDNGKHPGGRPSDYNPKTYPEMVEMLAARGTVKEDLWIHFGVSNATIFNWFNEHPEFLEAYKKGLNHTAENVNSKMYKMALGYTEETEKVFCDPKTGKVTRVPVTIRHQPNPACLIFAQKNLNGWTDKQDVDVSGNINLVVDKDDEKI